MDICKNECPVRSMVTKSYADILKGNIKCTNTCEGTGSCIKASNANSEVDKPCSTSDSLTEVLSGDKHDVTEKASDLTEIELSRKDKECDVTKESSDSGEEVLLRNNKECDVNENASDPPDEVLSGDKNECEVIEIASCLSVKELSVDGENCDAIEKASDLLENVYSGDEKNRDVPERETVLSKCYSCEKVSDTSENRLSKEKGVDVTVETYDPSEEISSQDKKNCDETELRGSLEIGLVTDKAKCDVSETGGDFLKEGSNKGLGDISDKTDDSKCVTLIACGDNREQTFMEKTTGLLDHEISTDVVKLDEGTVEEKDCSDGIQQYPIVMGHEKSSKDTIPDHMFESIITALSTYNNGDNSSANEVVQKKIDCAEREISTGNDNLHECTSGDKTTEFPDSYLDRKGATDNGRGKNLIGPFEESANEVADDTALDSVVDTEIHSKQDEVSSGSCTSNRNSECTEMVPKINISGDIETRVCAVPEINHSEAPDTNPFMKALSIFQYNENVHSSGETLEETIDKGQDSDTVIQTTAEMGRSFQIQNDDVKSTDQLALSEEMDEKGPCDKTPAGHKNRLINEKCWQDKTCTAFRKENHRDTGKLVCGIDFGTTYTGIAYGYSDHPDDVQLAPLWANANYYPRCKTSTSVLTGKEGEFVAFGFQAEYLYSKRCLTGGADDVELYKNFKMKLYKEKDLGNQTIVTSVRGTPRQAIDIFTMALKELKALFLEWLIKQDGRVPAESSLIWIITIPSIWSEKARYFMRKAAFKAGLIKEIYSRQLMLALEPEAASVYVNQLAKQSHVLTNIATNEEQAITLDPGNHYMLVDAGGGTVDITSHEVLPCGNIKEISAASGGETGGNGVNEKFEQMMKAIFGNPFITYFQKMFPHFWLEQCQLFEQNKKKINQEEQGSISIPLARRFAGSYHEKTLREVKDAVNEWYQLGVCIEDNELKLGFPVVFELNHGNTQSVVESIMSHLQQIKDCSRLKYIFLVGGFSQSEFLRATLSNTLGSNYTLLTPNYPSFAVVKGAVMYGHKPQTIAARMAKRTYGYSVYMPFEEDIHDPNRKVFDEYNQPYCENVFEKYVTVGEEVSSDEVRTFTASPWLSTATSLTKEIYATNKEEVMYTDGPDVEKIAEINLDNVLDCDEVLLEQEELCMDIVSVGRPAVGRIKDEKAKKKCKKVIEIQVKFGGTELEIEAWNKTNKDEKVDVQLNYLLL